MAKYGQSPKAPYLRLESLSLAGSKWTGIMLFANAGYYLKQLDVSGTNITDLDFGYITEVRPTPGAKFKRQGLMEWQEERP